MKRSKMAILVPFHHVHLNGTHRVQAPAGAGQDPWDLTPVSLEASQSGRQQSLSPIIIQQGEEQTRHQKDYKYFWGFVLQWVVSD